MSGADPVDRAPKTLLDFRTPDAVRDLAKGCDSDVGGLSTSALTLEADPVDTGVQSNGGQPYLRFWGEMRTDVRPEARRRLRGGYAGFRNQARVSPWRVVRACGLMRVYTVQAGVVRRDDMECREP